MYFLFTKAEAATVGVPQEKMSLRMSQNPHENICVGVSFLKKLQAFTFFKEHLRATIPTKKS